MLPDHSCSAVSENSSSEMEENTMGFASKAFAAMMLVSTALPAYANTALDSQSEPTTPPSVFAFDQGLSDDKVVVQYAYLPVNGYVAIYAAEDNGKAKGEPLGFAKIYAGAHSMLKVNLKKKPEAGQTLWLALYKDTDGDPSFKPGDGDKAVWAKAELPAENRFVVK